MSTLPSFDARVGESESKHAHSAEAATVDHAKTDLWIFRDGRKAVSGDDLHSALLQKLETLHGGNQTDALIEAGELECGLADLRHPDLTLASEVTDILAERVCGGITREASRFARRITPPESINIAPPEGFTYYALHPLDFACLVKKLPADATNWAIVGIRSIGTTLSAVAAAALRISGCRAQRITVRPQGHPYNRSLSFSPTELQWVRQQLSAPVQFLIVDEGPGRSGSTFLSVAEELLRAGVPTEAITIAGSRSFDAASLCAQDAVRRWEKFRFLATAPSVNSRFKDCLYVGGGEWRAAFYESEASWPASWTQMERLKFLSPDRKTLFKFEGMGRIGAQARDRALSLSRAGFAPHAEDAGDGFVAYTLYPGTPLNSLNVDHALLDHAAKYCAFRVTNFSSTFSDAAELARMLKYNLEQEFGWTSPLELDHLFAAQPVLVDGAMQPHEWVLTSQGRFIKTDGVSHGDNHFFPGPCDIVWDLAGMAIEWQLQKDATEYLQEQFCRYSGQDVRERFLIHMLAYSIFRMGFCKMALSTVCGSPEEARLRSAYHGYRNQAVQILRPASGIGIQDLLDCGRNFPSVRLHGL